MVVVADGDGGEEPAGGEVVEDGGEPADGVVGEGVEA